MQSGNDVPEVAGGRVVPAPGDCVGDLAGEAGNTAGKLGIWNIIRSIHNWQSMVCLRYLSRISGDDAQRKSLRSNYRYK